MQLMHRNMHHTVDPGQTIEQATEALDRYTDQLACEPCPGGLQDLNSVEDLRQCHINTSGRAVNAIVVNTFHELCVNKPRRFFDNSYGSGNKGDKDMLCMPYFTDEELYARIAGLVYALKSYAGCAVIISTDHRLYWDSTEGPTLDWNVESRQRLLEQKCANFVLRTIFR